MIAEKSHQELQTDRDLDQFQNIVETVREPLVILDSDLRVTVASRSFYGAFNLTKEEAEGRFIYELGDRQWDIPALRRMLEKVLAERTACDGFAVDHDFLRVGRRVLMLNARPFFSPEDKSTTILLAIEDITERQRTSEKLRIYAARAERSQRELQDFAQVASHDLQEPVRKILAFGDRINKKAGDSLDEECRDYLRRMANAAGRMQNLITDLMTFARIETKAQPFVKTDLGVIARQVSAELETRIEQSGGSLVIDELPTIDADPTQMRQLLRNLIGNSLKYQRQDVAPMVRVGSQKLDPRYADFVDEVSLGQLCQISIADNGIGFDEKHLDRIFTVFQRLHKKGEYEGTGAGLAICRKIVDRHGGAITARSVPGEGATFFVTMPLVQRKEVEVL